MNCKQCTDLIGKKGLCEALGIAETSYGQYQKRGLIPPPDHLLDDRVPMWHAAKIPAWLKAHPTIGSRPRQSNTHAQEDAA